MEQFVIVLIIAAVSLIKWVMEKAAEARAQREASQRFERPEQTTAPEESMRPAPPPPLAKMDDAARRLREALGLPEEEALPPPVPRLKPVIRFERPLPEGSPMTPFDDLERRFIAVDEEGPAAPFVPSPSPIQIHREEAPRPPAAAGLDDLLRSRDGLRKAVLIQEILGPPKGLAF